MSNLTERRLGIAFGLVGGALVLLGSLVSLLVGVVDLAFGHLFAAIGSISLAAVLFVLGGLALLFAWLARREWKDRPLASGVMLVVLAALGWAFLGLGENAVSLVGALFVLVGGVLLLVDPAQRAVTTLVPA
jgi:peptidoglycan/LPS O-acetylase OafA/YrhL